jgi:hypothetical protein
MAIETNERTARKPPKIANQLVKLLLRSPMHRLISHSLLLLTFTGQKSGKRYTIPLGYAHRGDTLMLFTDHNWYKNLLAQSEVKVRLQGKELSGIAEAGVDNLPVAQLLQLCYTPKRGGVLLREREVPGEQLFPVAL